MEIFLPIFNAMLTVVESTKMSNVEEKKRTLLLNVKHGFDQLITRFVALCMFHIH
jgi:hypothetical protein